MARFSKREGKTIEFKEKLVNFSRLIKTCVAFANGIGGEIIIGVKDKNQEIIGISDQELSRLFEDFQHTLYDSVSPKLFCQVYEQNFDDKKVGIIKVYPGSNKPYFYKKDGTPNGIYIRAGASIRRADKTYIEELTRESRKVSFDEEDSGKPIEILSQKLLQSYYRGNITDNTLINDYIAVSSPANPEILNATNCGTICFTDDPTYFISEAHIICSRFKDNSTRTIIKTKDTYGNIEKLADDTFELIKDWITIDLSLKGTKLTENTLIPLDALREAIINSIIHRKYTIPAPIKIALFDNRLEIFSPGNLPGLVTVESLGNGVTFLRNPRLVNIARKMRLVEKLGSGVKLIFESCKNANLRKPEYIEGDDFVKLIFFFEPSNRSSFEESIKTMLRNKDYVKTEDLLEITELSRNTITRKLNSMIEEGKLKRIGKGRGTKYIKI